jgi:hypothetical protein
LIKTYNFGQNAVNKSQFKNKNEQFCTFGCLFSPLPRLFVDFLSAIVVIFYRGIMQGYPVYIYFILTHTTLICIFSKKVGLILMLNLTNMCGGRNDALPDRDLKTYLADHVR